jgi:hypothetical protein
MSIEAYEKLKEAELEAASTKKRYTHDEVMSRLKKIISQSETLVEPVI